MGLYCADVSNIVHTALVCVALLWQCVAISSPAITSLTVSWVSAALCSRRQKALPTHVRKACQDQWRGGRGAKGQQPSPLS